MRSFARILCPIDLSDASLHAFEHAALVARWYEAKITALHICNPLFIPSGEFTVGRPTKPPQLTDDEIKEIREEVLTFVGAHVRRDVDVVVESGSPWNQILLYAQSLSADLIVLGTHGLSGFEHVLLGSVTEKVVRRATCPVMTVPPRAQSTSRLPFTRLLCPIDFSAPSLAGLTVAFSLAKEGDAQLSIANVFDWPAETVPPSPEYRQDLERHAAAKLDALIPDSVRQYSRPTTRLLYGKAYEEILRAAAEERSDLIVMGVHGRNALDLMIFGSTTNQVVRRATCPVLTVPG